jgi:hypothetical protein
MITAHRHSTLVNSGKAEALVALFPAFGEALGGLQSLTRARCSTASHCRGGGSCPKTHCLSPIACRRGR